MAQDQELKDIKEMLSGLISEQKEIRKELTAVGTSVTKIQTRLIGDEYGGKGLVSEVKEIQAYVEADKKQKNRLYGGVVVIGFIWTILWEFLRENYINKI